MARRIPICVAAVWLFLGPAPRIAQEVHRLGGDYAHVLAETIEPRRDDRTTEAWMYGRFTYMLYRRRA